MRSHVRCHGNTEECAETAWGHVMQTELPCPTCAGGKAPYAPCKRLAAILYAMEEFNQLGYTRDRVTCTDELQTWNKPQRRTSEPMKLSKTTCTKLRGKTSKVKRQAGEHQYPRSLPERVPVTARLHAHLEDLERKLSGLFMLLVSARPDCNVSSKSRSGELHISVY